MRTKYIVRCDGQVYGIRYDEESGEIMIGGPRKHFLAMEQMARDLRVRTMEWKFEHNRVRGIGLLPLDEWTSTPWTLKRGWCETERFGRLMG